MYVSFWIVSDYLCVHFHRFVSDYLCVHFHRFFFILTWSPHSLLLFPKVADLAEEEDAANVGFTTVLKAVTDLLTEIDIVKHQMSPCFAPHRHVEAL